MQAFLPPNKTQIKRALIAIENPMPEDDLITDYKDFLRVRDFLHYYQFNPKVFGSLTKLCNALWHSEKRINRLSLVNSLKSYGKRTEPINGLPLDVRQQLFELFRKSFEEANVLRENQVEEIRSSCNYLLKGIVLGEKEEKWLCENVEKSEMVLNRVLRYPAASETISRWAKENYNSNTYRQRRAELVSWRIDENPAFEVSKQTLLEDFEYFNQLDLASIEQYDDEEAAREVVEKEFGAFLPEMKIPRNESEFLEDLDRYAGSDIKMTRRFYKVPLDTSADYPVDVPDFEKLRDEFYDNIDRTQKITMIWAIGYSRLSKKQKGKLLRKYSSDESNYSLVKVCRRFNVSGVLKWMLDEQIPGK